MTRMFNEYKYNVYSKSNIIRLVKKKQIPIRRKYYIHKLHLQALIVSLQQRLQSLVEKRYYLGTYSRVSTIRPSLIAKRWVVRHDGTPAWIRSRQICYTVCRLTLKTTCAEQTLLTHLEHL